jgi:Aldo/keto reductase family
VDEIQKLASKRGCKLSHIALAWVAAQGLIAIPGTTKSARLQENWASREIELTEEEKQEMRRIIDVAKPEGNRYGPRSRLKLATSNPRFAMVNGYSGQAVQLTEGAKVKSLGCQIFSSGRSQNLFQVNDPPIHDSNRCSVH